MDLAQCIRQQKSILMEGALGERLKREHHLAFDPQVAMARLVYDPRGAAALRHLWGQYLHIAEQYGLPFLATTPTRRANRERMALAGLDGTVIWDNVRFLRRIQSGSSVPMYVGGLMGCRGDAYTGEGALSAPEALAFHRWQAEQFQKAGADFLYAGIMPTLPEAIGMAQAMSGTGLPYLISFTIQRDGRLIDGTTIHDAICHIDQDTDRPPLCYMTNCVHPSIVREALLQPFNRTEMVQGRFWGVQGNTSPLSYAELDGAKELRSSAPEPFAEEMLRLREVGDIRIFGGCCGTDQRHMEAIARRLQA